MIAHLTVAQCMVNTIDLLQSQSAHSHEFSGLLICDDVAILEKLNALPFTGSWTFMGLQDFGTVEFSQRYDLAVLIFTDNATDTPHATGTPYASISICHLAVQRCRDIFADHTLIFAPDTQDYIAFGFSKLAEEKIALDEENWLTGWQFNLFDYKQLPDWFNSRFWANPENWNKFRW